MKLFNIEIGRKVTIQSLAEEELYEAERKLMEAQTGVEWAQSQVEYQSNRVARLRKQIAANKIANESIAYKTPIKA